MAGEVGVEVLKSPKELATQWANKGLPWAAKEYAELANLDQGEIRVLMTTAHSKAAARYELVNTQGSKIPGNAFSVSDDSLLGEFVHRLVNKSTNEQWGTTFYNTLKYGGVYVRAFAQETLLNFQAHKELADFYKKS